MDEQKLDRNAAAGALGEAILTPSPWGISGGRYAPATLPLGAGRVGRAVRDPDESVRRTGSQGERMLAPAAPDLRPSQAPQRCSEPVGACVRPMPVIIGASGSFEGRTVRRTGAVVPGLFFRNVSMRGWALPPQRKKG